MARSSSPPSHGFLQILSSYSQAGSHRRQEELPNPTALSGCRAMGKGRNLSELQLICRDLFAYWVTFG